MNKPVNSTRNCVLIVAILSLFSLCCSKVLAHESAPAKLEMLVGEDNTLQVQVQLDVENYLASAWNSSADPHSDDHIAELDKLSMQSNQALKKLIDKAIDDEKMPFKLVDLHANPLSLVLDAVNITVSEANPGVREASIHFTTSIEADDQQVRIVSTEYGGALIASTGQKQTTAATDISQVVYLNPGNQSPPLSLGTAPKGGAALVLNQMSSGFFHVVPMGIDHVLFVLALVALASGWRRLAWQLSLFTLAHSITFIVASTGHIAVPTKLVEWLIGVSIIYMAIEIVRSHQHKRIQSVIVFLFGLVHGLGFATALSGTAISVDTFLLTILAFNVGVELAHVLVVVLCWSVKCYIDRHSDVRERYIGIPVSIMIGSAGCWMVLERSLS